MELRADLCLNAPKSPPILMNNIMKESSANGLLKLFTMLDTDGNDCISRIELKRELTRFGFSEKQIKDFSKKLDLNGDEEITLDEYRIALGIPFDVTSRMQPVTARSKEYAKLMNLFAKADVNKNGVLTKEELFRVLQHSHYSPAELQVKCLDLNEDGVVTLGEYKVALGIAYETLEQWEKLFTELDRDNSGDLNVDELKLMFQQAGMPVAREAIEEWLADYDRNGDKKLNRAEFMTFVASQAEKPLP
ncbi:unnamed protein product [Echinostoma caproni]|uniref:Calmodulin n=1 Tax=Echinostoma caproni TaxID=27848 RepID=A0A183AIL8_9TREM|nr:unnamed protein product [Echinostoma caproni]